MQNSIVRHTIVLIAALSVALVNTGCKSTGWNMPGSSWASWGKKKPPTSSIAGTRTTPQPPSVTVPPYPSTVASTSPTSPLNGTASHTGTRASQPATSPAAYGATPRYPTQQTASNRGYFTGPYNTGQASTAGTQHGFYSPTMSKPAAPAAYTADARNRNTPLPTGSATRSTRPAASAGYPARSPYGPPPAPSYPTSTTPNRSSVPSYSNPATTQPRSVYPPSATRTGTYGTPSYKSYGAPGSYPTQPTRTPMAPASTSTRPNTSPYGAIPVSATGPIRTGNTHSSATRTATAGSQPKSYAAPSSGVYQPGSTARASNLLPPTTSGTASPSYATTPTTSRYGPSASAAYQAPAYQAPAYQAQSQQTPAYQKPSYPGTTYQGPSSGGYPAPTQTATPTGSTTYPSTYNR